MRTSHLFAVKHADPALYGVACRWTQETMSQLQKAEHAAAAHASSGNGGHLHTYVLSNAGHWVHVDNPQGLMDMMLPSFVDTDIC